MFLAFIFSSFCCVYNSWWYITYLLICSTNVYFICFNNIVFKKIILTNNFKKINYSFWYPIFKKNLYIQYFIEYTLWK